MKKLAKILLLILPCTIYFSFSPRILLGKSEYMNFELSIPLIFLCIFGIFTFIYMLKNFKFDKKAKKAAALFSIFPIYSTISILWSSNKIHGILAAGIIWLLFYSAFALVFIYKEFFENKKFQKLFVKTFLIFSLIICALVWLQCVLDLAGISQIYTVMCDGCTTRIFGFPHPNGFMAEPQYMGGVLIAPALLSLYIAIKKSKFKYFALATFLTSTLFLTFSRGAIYAFAVGLIVLVVAEIIKTKNAKPLLLILTAFISFLITLNFQGIFAQISFTDDTYLTGVNKVINQLSLGIINFKPKDNQKDESKEEQVEIQKKDNESVWDGYVEVSTNVRLNLSRAALTLWTSKPNYIINGVGLGSASMSIYQDFVDPGTVNNQEIKNMLVTSHLNDPSLNVQNGYVEVLLEFGIIGTIIVIAILVAIIIFIKKHQESPVLFAILAAYLIAAVFCSGLTNSLYIYSYIPIIYISLRKKLVS